MQYPTMEQLTKDPAHPTLFAVTDWLLEFFQNAQDNPLGFIVFLVFLVCVVYLFKAFFGGIGWIYRALFK